jgi:hypothetical protein
MAVTWIEEGSSRLAYSIGGRYSPPCRGIEEAYSRTQRADLSGLCDVLSDTCD